MTLFLQKNTINMITKWKQAMLVVMALLSFIVSKAQFYPVQTTTQLIPPYSVYLSDYATGGNEKLRVILLQRDLTQPSYQLRLVMTVELNGQVIMRTSRAYNPPPINLNPGIPTVISGAELAPYVDSRNIDFVGYSRDQYERTKALPEGSYQITFTAYDYRRQDVQVSNAGISFYYLSKNEPPLINFPACGTKVPMRTPQQIVFSWLSRNTASPNSAADTEFELSLYETRPEGRNPNDVVLSTQPVFRITVDLSQYIYSPSDPLLLSGMKYVWRVRAIDRNGKDAFRNNGYSEVCTFTYGGNDPDFDMGVVKNLQAEGETERKGRIWWDLGDYDGYVANYRKTGEGYEWFTSTITKEELAQAAKTQGEVKLFDLEPDTEYETRVQPKKSGFLGAYTDIVKFRTKPHVVAQCGVNPNLPQADLTRPMRSGIKGMLIQVDDIEIQLMDVLHLGDGWYKGTGRTSIPYFGGAVFAVTFDRLFIDENRIAGLGRIDFVTQGVAALVEQQSANLAIRKKEAIQQANREEWAGTDFFSKVFVYDDIVIDKVTATDIGYISITDSQGNTTVNAEVAQILLATPDKAIIIQDKNGDQYVVQKDGDKTKVTKVEGGGLPPASDVIVTDEEIDLLKKALKEIKKDYTESRLTILQNDFNAKKKVLSDYNAATKQDILSGVSTSDNVNTEDAIVLESQPTAVSSDQFSSISIAFKQAERNYNLGKVSKLFARETNTGDEYKIIVQNIQINDMAYGAYVSKRKSEGAKQDELINEIKVGIIATIGKILDEKY